MSEHEIGRTWHWAAGTCICKCEDDRHSPGNHANPADLNALEQRIAIVERERDELLIAAQTYKAPRKNPWVLMSFREDGDEWTVLFRSGTPLGEVDKEGGELGQIPYYLAQRVANALNEAEHWAEQRTADLETELQTRAGGKR